MYLRGIALLYKRIRHIQRDDDSFLEEFPLNAQIHIHGGRTYTLRITIPVIKTGKAEIPEPGGNIIDVEVRVERSVVLVFVDRLIISPILAVNIIESQICFQRTGESIARPGSHCIFGSVADILIGCPGSAIRLKGGNLGKDILDFVEAKA